MVDQLATSAPVPHDPGVDHHRFLRVVYDNQSSIAVHALSGRGLNTVQRLQHIVSLDNPGAHVVNDVEPDRLSGGTFARHILSHSVLPPPINRVVFVCGAPETGKTTSALAWLAAHPDDIVHVSCFFPKTTIDSNRKRLGILGQLDWSAHEFTTVDAIEEAITAVSKKHHLQSKGTDRLQVVLLDDTTGLDSNEFQMNKKFVSMLTTCPQHHRVCFIFITHQFKNRLPSLRQSVWALWLFGYIDTIRQNTSEIGSIFPVVERYLAENGDRNTLGLAAFRDSANLEVLGHKPQTETLLYVLDEADEYISSVFLREQADSDQPAEEHPLSWHQVDPFVSNALDRETLARISSLKD